MAITEIEVEQENKFLCLVGSHRLGIVCPDKNKILLGRGSIGILNNIRYYHQKQQTNTVLEVGDFCETSVHSTILIGGEHNNRSAWNLVYAGLPVVPQAAANAMQGPLATSKGQSLIGDNVVLSYGCLVVSGSNIGNGSIIGANSVVAGTVPPKVMWVGNPGVAKPRFKSAAEEKIHDEIKWKEIRVADLQEMEKMVRMGDIAGIKNHFQNQKPLHDSRLWFEGATKDRQIQIKHMLGVMISEKFYKPSQFPRPFIDYFQQANATNATVKWVPDAFEEYWQ